MAGYGNTSPYYTAVSNTLEKYVPLPFQEMMAASQGIQQRADKALDQQAATESMLSNIEALAPEHKNYITNVANDFRTRQSELLNKYNGDASNPEFIRESRSNIMKASADQNFRTILTANERLKQNDSIARKMRAEGRLFLNPEFSGKDSNGNLIDNVGEVELVDTLDKLRTEYDIAWKSMENNNKGTISNKSNIDRQNKRVLDSIKNNSPEFTKLAQAYMQQGMTQEQATRRLQSDISGLQGQYGIRSERDNSYYSHQLALRNEVRNAQEHKLKMAQLLSTMGGENSPNILKGTMLNGIVSNKDLNPEKKEIISNMRKVIDNKGNLKLKEGRENNSGGKTYNSLNSGKGSGMSSSQPFKSESNLSKTKEKSYLDTLQMMRTELGWPKSGKNSGNAKQVVDAYENLTRNDNLISSVYVPGNSTVFNGIERTFKSDLSGADVYVNGKKDILKEDNLAEATKNASFSGISMSNGGVAIFKSFSDKDKTKAITMTVPLDNNTKRLLNSNLKIAKILDQFPDNTQLETEMKSNGLPYLRKDSNGNLYLPRKTSNGLRYAQAEVDENGNFIDFKRNNVNGLNYMNDEVVENIMRSEYSTVDKHLEYIFK